MNSLFKHLDAHRDQIDDPEFESGLWSRFGAEHTVVVVDMAGFTAVSHEKGVLHYLTLIQEMRALTRPLVEAQSGRVVKFEADNLFAIFANPTDALAFISEAFVATNKLNIDRERTARLKLCAGLDHGQILLDDADFYGNAVNLASKLGEDMARAGEILVSQEIINRIGETEHHFEEIGSHGFYGCEVPVYILKHCCESESEEAT